MNRQDAENAKFKMESIRRSDRSKSRKRNPLSPNPFPRFARKGERSACKSLLLLKLGFYGNDFAQGRGDVIHLLMRQFWEHGQADDLIGDRLGNREITLFVAKRC